MPPRVQIRLSSCRPCAPAKPWAQRRVAAIVQRRGFADDRPIAERPLTNPPNSNEEEKGPNMDQLPHVSEEKAAVSKSMGEEGPAMDQGKPVSEIVKGDKKAQENLPKVMQEQIKQQEQDAANNQKRSFSTYARAQSGFRARSTPFSAYRSSDKRRFSTSSWRRLALEGNTEQASYNEVMHQVQELAAAEPTQVVDASQTSLLTEQGLKFGRPMKLAKAGHLRKRYEPIVEQVTKLMMKDGKLSQAQRHMEAALRHLRTSPSPRASPTVTLVPGAPPHDTLPTSPSVYIQVAIDSIAPLLRMRSLKGMAGGGMALQVPAPLGLRQRRREAIVWILEQVEKRKGSTSPFGKRFGEEIVAIVEGRSGIWERRNALHALAMRSRANMAVAKAKLRK